MKEKKKNQEKTTSRSTGFMTQTHPDEEAEKKSLNPPNGVGMRFESLILHADGFFFPFCAIDQHDMPNCINGLLYDDKITG